MTVKRAGKEPFVLAPDDQTLLDRLQRHAFEYFMGHTSPVNGLVADTSRPDSPSSIATVGFALSAYPIGVEHGWISREEAVQRTLITLRFFWHSDQSGTAESTGFHGFYYHFLHMNTGKREWSSEISLIDSALLLAGMLTSATYFSRDEPEEAELRKLASALYGRANWPWAQSKGGALVHGWKPEGGFLHYGWQGYSEAILLYVLALGSPTYPLVDTSFERWSLTYQWENLYGYDFLYAGPLFIHQYSHAWIDFRGIQDQFMREKHCDYFENSRRATYVQREYAIRNPHSFVGYNADCWGLSAGDGPSMAPRIIAGEKTDFVGYAARGVPYGPDDGTISGPAILSSIVFAPEIVLPAVRALLHSDLATGERKIHASGFNTTITPEGWISEGECGLDQGIIVLMIENFRSGLLWNLSQHNSSIRTGLGRAGFRGGWLSQRQQR